MAICIALSKYNHVQGRTCQTLKPKKSALKVFRFKSLAYIYTIKQTKTNVMHGTFTSGHNHNSVVITSRTGQKLTVVAYSTFDKTFVVLNGCMNGYSIYDVKQFTRLAGLDSQQVNKISQLLR
jgi:hypothetical protein